MGLRLAGVSFESTAWILVLFNVPPLIFVIRSWQKDREPTPPRTLLLYGLVYLLAVLFLAFSFWPEKVRIYGGGHLWFRADTIYSLASGNLPPEERQIAGLWLSYPWLFYVQQALFSYLLDWSHLSNYFLVNLFWLISIIFFGVRIVSEFGVRPTTQALSLVFLFFGVNFIGFILTKTFPIMVGNYGASIWGDERYTPWLLKFINSTPMIPGLCSILALLYTLTRNPMDHKVGWTVIVAVLLVSTGFIYPLLLPVGCVFICARVGALLVEKSMYKAKVSWWEIFMLCGVLVMGVALSFGHVMYLTQDRTNSGVIQFSSLLGMGRKLVENGIVLSMLWVGLLFSVRRCWKESRFLTNLLIFGALGCLVLNIVFAIPGYSNEYKYIFAVAMCLFSFPAIALEPVIKRLGRLAFPIVAVGSLLLGSPMLKEVRSAHDIRQHPELHVSHFHVRLADSEPLAPVMNAISETTPENTILVLDYWEMYWPTLTQRSVYISPAQFERPLSTHIPTIVHLNVAGGYGDGLINARRAVVANLYQGPGNQERMDSLLEIQKLGRPLVVILNKDRHLHLLQWLQNNSIGNRLADNQRLLAWFIPAKN